MYQNRWRTKQNLDYAFLMMYAVNKGLYYVQVRRGIYRWHVFTSDIELYIQLQKSVYLNKILLLGSQSIKITNCSEGAFRFYAFEFYCDVDDY